MEKRHYTSSAMEGAGTFRGRRDSYDQLEATELHCPECRRAVPVTKSLLLILPEGDKYEYCCRFCGSKVGDKIDRSGNLNGIIRP